MHARICAYCWTPRHHRQLTGVCGPLLVPNNWTASYEASENDQALADQVMAFQLNLLVCAPFGDYELELVADTHVEETAPSRPPTFVTVVDGNDEVGFHIEGLGVEYGSICFTWRTPTRIDASPEMGRGMPFVSTRVCHHLMIATATMGAGHRQRKKALPHPAAT